jgi:hypothetical protein
VAFRPHPDGLEKKIEKSWPDLSGIGFLKPIYIGGKINVNRLSAAAKTLPQLFLRNRRKLVCLRVKGLKLIFSFLSRRCLLVAYRLKGQSQ